jgi:hypothetical protein
VDLVRVPFQRNNAIIFGSHLIILFHIQQQIAPKFLTLIPLSEQNTLTCCNFRHHVSIRVQNSELRFDIVRDVNSSSSMAQQPDVGPWPPESSPSIPLYPALLSSSSLHPLTSSHLLPPHQSI